PRLRPRRRRAGEGGIFRQQKAWQSSRTQPRQTLVAGHRLSPVAGAASWIRSGLCRAHASQGRRVLAAGSRDPRAPRKGWIASKGSGVQLSEKEAGRISKHRIAPLSWPRHLLAGVVWLYQKVISLLFPGQCRFTPTCSEYTRQALLRYGVLKGGYLGVRRLLKCHPWHPGGYDPVQ